MAGSVSAPPSHEDAALIHLSASEIAHCIAKFSIMRTDDAQVLIAGAGPAGLTSACDR